MSIHQSPSLETIPVELLYHICDFLDPKTILTSFRYTCRRLKKIMKNYYYILNFESTSFSNFRRICRLIDSHQVKSLTLSEKNISYEQALLFNSWFGVKKFTQLRSLKLIAIRESRLRDILKHIDISSLISFSLNIAEYKQHDNHLTTTYLNSILIRSKLQKLVLNIRQDRIDGINWNYGPEIEYLQIDPCIDFHQINTILRCKPRLKTFIADCHFFEENLQHINFDLHQQLTKLSLTKLNIGFDDLKRILISIPSLTYLKLIGNGNFSDGHRWEQLIQKNLPLLKKFEFVFTEERNSQDIQFIIASFQTPFWLRLKEWFVMCEYEMESPERIKLYSIPICLPSLNLNNESVKIAVSSSITIDYNPHVLIINNRIIFDFKKLTSNDIAQHEIPNNHTLFHSIDSIGLLFDSHRPVGWVEFVSLFINLTAIKNIILEGTLILKADSETLNDIKLLLQRTSNASSVILCRTMSKRQSLLTAKHICSMIPTHIQRLTVAITDFHEAKIVLDQLENILMVNFLFNQTSDYDQVHQWFKMRKQYFSYKIEPLSLCIWRRKKLNSLDELKVTTSHKRIKLDDDHREE